MKIQEIVTHHQKWQWRNKKFSLLIILQEGDQYGCLSLFKSFIHSRPFE